MSSQERPELVAVFAHRTQADVAADKVRALGVADEDIRNERPQDHVASLRGEMRDELERGLFSPQGGVLLTKRGIKGILAVTPFAIAGGVLLALPFAFVSWGSLPLWGRMLLAVVVGATAGAIVGFIIGGGEAEKGAGAPLAAEHGVTLRVSDARAEVQQVLVAAEPIRLDLVTADGAPLRSLTSESERNDEGVVEDLERAWHEPDRDLHDRHEDLAHRQQHGGGGERDERQR
jgi:hypothetical protein